MIRSSSSFFDKALAGEWKEALNRTVEMPSDDPDVFAVYMHWLYCGTIPILYHKERHSIKGDEFFSSAEHYALVKAYILGDKILDPRFQNAIIDAIAEKVNKEGQGRGQHYCPGSYVIRYVYENTRDLDPIRHLFAAIYVRYGDQTWILFRQDSLKGENNDNHLLPPTFLLDLAAALFQNQESLPPGDSLDPWMYHIEVPVFEREED